MNLLEIIITTTVAAPLGGFIVWFFQSRIEATRREREKLQDAQRKIYTDILSPYIRIFTSGQDQGVKALSQITSFEYRKVVFELNLMGSDDVVKAMNELMQYIYKTTQANTQLVPKDLFGRWGELLLAIRRDLGNKNTNLKPIDMLKSQIKDIDTAGL